MSNTKLCFYGTDFTPLKTSDGEYTFLLKTDRSDKTLESKKFEILSEFLKQAQEELDNVIIDKSLRKEEKRLYEYYGQQMCFGGLVGVITLKDFYCSVTNKKYDVSLQINTRLDAGVKDNDEYDAVNFDKVEPYFLMRLLFNDYKPTKNKVGSGETRFTDMLLLSLFIEKYKEAYVKGYFKTYHKFEKNDDRIKGSIDIARHLRINIGMNNGKVAYSYKEKSEFNYINHLIIAAYERLKSKYYDLSRDAFGSNMALRDSLESLKYLIDYPKYSDNMLITKNINPLSHPYYTEYEDLRKICLKILRNEKQSLFDGSEKQKVDGVFMYVPRLWEKYIEKQLRTRYVKSQDKIRILNVNDSREYCQLTIPDFVFYHGNVPFMILDAKFKPGWLKAARSGILEDLLPDYDKCIRDMVSINSHVTGVIFPTNHINFEYSEDGYIINGQEYKYQHNISEFNSTDKFYTFPVFIPERSEGFEQWKKSFDTSNEKLFESIRTIVDQVEPKSSEE